MLAGAGDMVHDAVHSSFSAMQELWMRLKHCTQKSRQESCHISVQLRSVCLQMSAFGKLCSDASMSVE